MACFFCAFSDTLRAWVTQERSAFSVTGCFLRFLIVCVLDIRFAGLPLVTSFFCAFFYNLRAVFTQERFTFGDLFLFAFPYALCVVFTLCRFAFGDLFLFCVLLCSACSAYAVRVYRMLGETTQGKGGSPAAIPLPLPGFLPQSPAFLLPHPPMV